MASATTSNYTVNEMHRFIFRDGTFNPPQLLRDTPEQNYLSPALRIVGLTLMSLTLLACVGFLVWIYVHRNHRVVQASQPIFLIFLIIGAAMTSLTLLFVSADEQAGLTTEQLGNHCMAMVWVASLGHLISYGSLFGKVRSFVSPLAPQCFPLSFSFEYTHQELVLRLSVRVGSYGGSIRLLNHPRGSLACIILRRQQSYSCW